MELYMTSLLRQDVTITGEEGEKNYRAPDY
jgi:hypothetical protein